VIGLSCVMVPAGANGLYHTPMLTS
jgi:hypothetical protein